MKRFGPVDSTPGVGDVYHVNETTYGVVMAVHQDRTFDVQDLGRRGKGRPEIVPIEWQTLAALARIEQRLTEVMSTLVRDEPSAPAVGPLSIRDAAQLIGISVATLYREIKKGNIATVHIGDRQLIRQEEIRRYLMAGQR